MEKKELKVKKLEKQVESPKEPPLGEILLSEGAMRWLVTLMMNSPAQFGDYKNFNAGSLIMTELVKGINGFKKEK